MASAMLAFWTLLKTCCDFMHVLMLSILYISKLMKYTLYSYAMYYGEQLISDYSAYA